MDKVITKVMNQIEESGYEAYIIGGFVRDLLLGINSSDVDICTNATPKELIKIFPSASSKNLGGIDFKLGTYHFEVTTYREEIKYKGRKPIEFNYIDNLLQDIKRRDFTINSICMNSKGEVIDLIRGMEDLKRSKIRMIGVPSIKIKEDPLRILRGIRLATVLNFNLDKEFYQEVKKNYKVVSRLSNTRIREEFDKILLSKYVKKGLNLLEELHILKILKIKNNENIIPVNNLEGMYAQLEFKYDFPFTKEEKTHISLLKEMINKGKIESYEVYHYGLYLSLIAGEILNIDKQTIAKIHKNLPIYDKKDIIVNASDIKEHLNINFSKKISIILNDIEDSLINGKIENTKEAIFAYLDSFKGKWL